MKRLSKSQHKHLRAFADQYFHTLMDILYVHGFFDDMKFTPETKSNSNEIFDKAALLRMKLHEFHDFLEMFDKIHQ